MLHQDQSLRLIMEQQTDSISYPILWNHSTQASKIAAFIRDGHELLFSLIFEFDTDNLQPFIFTAEESYTDLCVDVKRLFRLDFTPLLRIDWAPNAGIRRSVWLTDKNITATLWLLKARGSVDRIHVAHASERVGNPTESSCH